MTPSNIFLHPSSKPPNLHPAFKKHEFFLLLRQPVMLFSKFAKSCNKYIPLLFNHG